MENTVSSNEAFRNRLKDILSTRPPAREAQLRQNPEVTNADEASPNHDKGHFPLTQALPSNTLLLLQEIEHRSAVALKKTQANARAPIVPNTLPISKADFRTHLAQKLAMPRKHQPTHKSDEMLQSDDISIQRPERTMPKRYGMRSVNEFSSVDINRLDSALEKAMTGFSLAQRQGDEGNFFDFSQHRSFEDSANNRSDAEQTIDILSADVIDVATLNNQKPSLESASPSAFSSDQPFSNEFLVQNSSTQYEHNPEPSSRVTESNGEHDRCMNVEQASMTIDKTTASLVRDRRWMADCLKLAISIRSLESWTAELVLMIDTLPRDEVIRRIEHDLRERIPLPKAKKISRSEFAAGSETPLAMKRSVIVTLAFTGLVIVIGTISLAFFLN